MAVSVYTGAGGGVASFNGRKGKVVPADGDYTKAQVGLSNVDNTSDANKPISKATQAALSAKQSKITANGILKGNGSGNITAASETEVELVSLPNICNPNLLDNWYFGNPVNQRGKTSYTGWGYCIDRWIIIGDTTQLTVTSGSVKGVGYLVQKAEVYTSSSLEGMQLTLSALMSDNTFGSVTFHLIKGMENPSAINSKGYLVYAEWQNTNDFFTVNWKSDSEAVGLVAIKLELGSQQTLAHQENGVWVLNEIPDYAEQLLKCQRYLRPATRNFVVSNSSGNYYASAIMQSPYPMRTVPAIVNSDYTAQPIREATGGQTATVSQVFTPSVYGSFVMQLTPVGSSVPNFVYIDPSGFNPLLSAEL